jgi:hypothetical protein
MKMMKMKKLKQNVLEKKKKTLKMLKKEWKPKIGDVPSDITWYISRDKDMDPYTNILIDVNHYKPLSKQPYISTFSIPPQPANERSSTTTRGRNDNRSSQQSRHDSYYAPPSNNNYNNSRPSRFSDYLEPPASVHTSLPICIPSDCPLPILSFSLPSKNREPYVSDDISPPTSRPPQSIPPPPPPSARMNPPLFNPRTAPALVTPAPAPAPIPIANSASSSFSSAVPKSSSITVSRHISAPIAPLGYRDVGSYEKRLFDGDDDDDDSDDDDNGFGGKKRKKE